MDKLKFLVDKEDRTKNIPDPHNAWTESLSMQDFEINFLRSFVSEMSKS